MATTDAAMTDPYALAAAAADEIARRTGKTRHDAAVVLGSGWQDAVDGLGPPDALMSAAELPGLAPSTVPGHTGSVRSVRVGGCEVLVLVGRVHLYEGHEPAAVVHAVRAAVLAGAATVVLTNAAGGIDPGLRPGQAVLLRDHLNLMAASPLAGPPPPPGRPGRFVDLSDLYPAALRALALEVAADVGLDVREGVYAGLRGPHYETPAEIVMLRRSGADLVGMSTVLEAIAARHLGARVLGVSIVTNAAAGVTGEALDHADVLATGAAAAPRLGALLHGILARL
jgi:purine-nucleoside phosphorylase